MKLHIFRLSGHDFVHYRKIEIGANDRAVYQQSISCFIVYANFDWFLINLSLYIQLYICSSPCKVKSKPFPDLLFIMLYSLSFPLLSHSYSFPSLKFQIISICCSSHTFIFFMKVSTTSWFSSLILHSFQMICVSGSSA